MHGVGELVHDAGRAAIHDGVADPGEGRKREAREHRHTRSRRIRRLSEAGENKHHDQHHEDGDPPLPDEPEPGLGQDRPESRNSKRTGKIADHVGRRRDEPSER